MSLPKLNLVGCDEVSLKLAWEPSSLSSREALVLEWKQAGNPRAEWSSTSIQASSGVALVSDLEPGTPYSLRLKLGKSEGPECVYDTKPISCGPSSSGGGSGCIIS